MLRKTIITLAIFWDDESEIDPAGWDWLNVAGNHAKLLKGFEIPVTDEEIQKYGDPVFCDNCGAVLREDHVSYTEVPFNVESANAGESAQLCQACDFCLTKNMGSRG